MLLELEAAYGIADTPGSLMDHALVGMITAIRKRSRTVPYSDILHPHTEDSVYGPQIFIGLKHRKLFQGLRISVCFVSNF